MKRDRKSSWAMAIALWGGVVALAVHMFLAQGPGNTRVAAHGACATLLNARTFAEPCESS